MKRIGLRWLAAAFLLGLLAASGCDGLEPDADVTGTWTGTRVWQEGNLEGFASPFELVLTQEGRTVSGEVRVAVGQTMTPIPLTRGTVSGSAVILEASGTLSAGQATFPVTISLQGEVDGEVRMWGEGTETVYELPNPFLFEVERPAPPPPEEE